MMHFSARAVTRPSLAWTDVTIFQTGRAADVHRYRGAVQVANLATAPASIVISFALLSAAI
jgi:hypothetical protein